MSDSGDLQVRGGIGGVVARLEDLEHAGTRLCSLAAELAGHGRVLLALSVDPHLQSTMPLAPVTFVRAETALAAVGLGPSGLMAAAARVELLGLRIRTVATAYRAADATVSVALRTGTQLTGRVVGVSFGRVGPGALLGGATILTVAARRSGVLRGIGGLTLRLLAGRAALTEKAMPFLPGVLAGVTAAAPGGSLIAARVFGDPSGPDTTAEVATGLIVVGGVVGTVRTGSAWFQDSAPIQVRARSTPPVRPPTGADDLIGLIPGAGPGLIPGTGQSLIPGATSRPTSPPVHVERLDGGPGGRAWVVSVPGTANWSPAAGTTPFDLTGAVRSMARQRTAGMAAVVAAMRATGVRPDEPVLLVGHSQGGLIAAGVAADPAVRHEFTIRQVLTSGAPIASVPVPDDVQVLSIEHDHDLVPRLDGSVNPDRSNWITVSATAETQDLPAADRSEPLLAHRVELYRRTAARIDGSADPSLRHWRDGLTPFLDGPGRSAVGWDVEVSRAGTR